MLHTYIPSPSQGVWHLGPLPIRAYALCILLGIFVAIWLTTKRWVATGGKADDVIDVAMWAVPFGIVGGRLYHLITDPELYFTAGKDPVKALYIWDGGLGIWGAVALGRRRRDDRRRRHGVKLPAFLDAVAPGSSSRRRSAGGATTSTRSSTAGRPSSRGPWRSIPHTDLPTRPTSGCTTRHSCTSPSGTSAWPCC